MQDREAVLLSPIFKAGEIRYLKWLFAFVNQLMGLSPRSAIIICNLLHYTPILRGETNWPEMGTTLVKFEGDLQQSRR